MRSCIYEFLQTATCTPIWTNAWLFVSNVCKHSLRIKFKRCRLNLVFFSFFIEMCIPKCRKNSFCENGRCLCRRGFTLGLNYMCKASKKVISSCYEFRLKKLPFLQNKLKNCNELAKLVRTQKCMVSWFK